MKTKYLTTAILFSLACSTLRAVEVVDLGAVNQSRQAQSINSSGLVVGWSSRVGEGSVNDYAFIYLDGISTDLTNVPSRAYSVNDAGQVAFTRKLEVSAEDGALHIAGRVVVVIVEPDLAPCNHA